MLQSVGTKEFDRMVARNCGPVLLAAKPANMFTLRGRFATTCPADGALRLVEDERELPGEIVENRAYAQTLVDHVNEELAADGIVATVIAWRPFGAIVYLYRPELLGSHLADERIVAMLEEEGYDASAGLDGLIEGLGASFAAHRMPHEVGLFLGYPYEDVVGFIENGGKNYVYAGCWKAYADARGSYERFSRYRRCERRCCDLCYAGAPLSALTAPVREAGAVRSA